MTSPFHILIADDEESLRFVLRNLLEDMGYRVTEAEDGAQALAVLQNNSVDLAVLDIKMPEIDGLEVLRRGQQIHPDLITLMITAYGSNEMAMTALREGAYDYFTKPFEVLELRVTIQRALEKREMQNRIRELETRVGERSSYPEFIGVCDSMQEVFHLIDRVKDNDVPVLIAGESGTGKEMVANAIHQNGARRKGPLVKINCAAIPEALLESELFGHEKGAFTGALLARAGKFEEASGGTLFLDEIGEMPLALQAKILRAIQEQEIQRIGGSGTVKVDTRIISATNKKLAEEVTEKRFREDLYFRINVIAINLPPLRDRVSDIPTLVDLLIRRYSEKLNKPVRGLTPRVMDLLLQYDWPGNVRELQNVIQRALVMAVGSEIEPNDLPAHMLVKRRSDGPAVEYDRRLSVGAPMAAQIERLVEAAEKHLISDALRQTSSREEAADLLGISRKTLHNKMQRYRMGNE